MNSYIKNLIERNQGDRDEEVEKEIKRRNEHNHAFKTLMIMNEYVTGKRKEKWLREEWW